MSAAVDVYTITWTGRSVVLPLFGGNSVGAVEASATAPVEALRRTAPQGGRGGREHRRDEIVRFIPEHAKVASREGGHSPARAGVICVGPADWSSCP